MNTTKLNGSLFSVLVTAGANHLGANRTIVNDLNVFPIPDGDTGDNMYMTISSGCNALAKEENESLEEMSNICAKGMLLGARGNSGVILSRIFAGIAKGLKGIKEADVVSFSRALLCGVEEAYSAVSKPVEGTILSVYKDAVNYANSKITDTLTLGEYFKYFNQELKISLERTPDLLDVLKEAGVVDSGGAGIVYIAQGMQNVLEGKEVKKVEFTNNTVSADLSKFNEDSELSYGYCTEFLLQLQNSKVDAINFNENILKEYLEKVGDSVVCFKEGTVIKVHVHTKTPGDILNHCQQYGEFLTTKIENMTLQHNETTIQNNYSIKKSAPHKKYGIVTVATGDGIIKTFEDLGTDVVIQGGQSMNPSAEDFLTAFKEINADTILVFPNNSNIIMTAIQAANIYTDAKVEIITTKTIGEGYAAISMLDTTCDSLEDLLNEAQENIENVVTGMISIATRTTTKDDVEIKEGEYLGFTESKIHTSNSNKNDAIFNLCESLKMKNYDVAMLIQGINSTDEETEFIKNELEKKYRRTEVVVIKGNQPIYDYIIVLE